MTEGGMLYLILVGTVFLIFCGTLMWEMTETDHQEHAGQDRH